MRPSRRRFGVITCCAVMMAGAPRPALAGDETPSRREHTACTELRDASKLAEAAPRCRAAYHALPDDISEPPLNARSLIVFDAYHTYLEAFEATGDPAFLCAGEELLSDYLAYLDARLPADERLDDRKDARKDREELAKLRGDHACDEPEIDSPGEVGEDDLLPILARPRPPASPAQRPPPGLRIAGGVTLGGGLGLGLLAAGALVAGARIKTERDKVTGASEQVDIGPEGRALADQLDVFGTRANRIAIGSAIGAGATIVTSIILFAVDAHRRRAHRLSIAPAMWPAGGQLSIEF